MGENERKTLFKAVLSTPDQYSSKVLGPQVSLTPEVLEFLGKAKASWKQAAQLGEKVPAIVSTKYNFMSNELGGTGKCFGKLSEDEK